MKRLLIKFIKKVPFLYNIAKSINKKIYPNKFVEKKDDDNIYICYALDELEELEKVQEHYKLIQTEQTELLIIIKNNKYNLYMHELIENNPKINFISLSYIEKYHREISIKNLIFLDYRYRENLGLIGNPLIIIAREKNKKE